ncbi:MAG: sugar phosphate isomerase/epimerase family protein [Christensenellales bacterium]|jgi:sugar phosphate isomerase/epimerase
MRICVQTAPILDRYGIDAGFRMISEAGFDGVDFNIDHTLPYDAIVEGRTVPLYEAGEDALIAAIAPYKEAAEKYNIVFHQMHAPFPTYVKNEAGNAYVMRAIKACIRVCGYIGCKYIIVHPNFYGYDDKLSPEAEWDINIARYSELIEVAREYDVIVCLENMFTSHNQKIYAATCADMAEANRYIDALNEIAGETRFGFCLDVGHALLVGKEIYSTILELGDRLVTLHIHDNDGASDQHLFPYMGIMDWDRFTKGLRDAGYKGALSFETFNALNVINSALAPEALRFLHDIGRLFASEVTG